MLWCIYLHTSQFCWGLACDDSAQMPGRSDKQYHDGPRGNNRTELINIESVTSMIHVLIAEDCSGRGSVPSQGTS